jgi:hypothetical protein
MCIALPQDMVILGTSCVHSSAQDKGATEKQCCQSAGIWDAPQEKEAGETRSAPQSMLQASCGGSASSAAMWGSRRSLSCSGLTAAGGSAAKLHA